jgi:hypothetical protein
MHSHRGVLERYRYESVHVQSRIQKHMSAVGGWTRTVVLVINCATCIGLCDCWFYLQNVDCPQVRIHGTEHSVGESLSGWDNFHQNLTPYRMWLDLWLECIREEWKFKIWFWLDWYVLVGLLCYDNPIKHHGYQIGDLIVTGSVLDENNCTCTFLWILA